MADDALGRRAFVRAGGWGGKINGVMSENDVGRARARARCRCIVVGSALRADLGVICFQVAGGG